MPDTFRVGAINGVIVRPLSRFNDSRGWLIELFRVDEWPAEFHPVMAYISSTLPGVTRGPHEHVDQADGGSRLASLRGVRAAARMTLPLVCVLKTGKHEAESRKDGGSRATQRMRR